MAARKLGNHAGLPLQFCRHLADKFTGRPLRAGFNPALTLNGSRARDFDELSRVAARPYNSQFAIRNSQLPSGDLSHFQKRRGPPVLFFLFEKDVHSVFAEIPEIAIAAVPIFFLEGEKGSFPYAMGYGFEDLL